MLCTCTAAVTFSSVISFCRDEQLSPAVHAALYNLMCWYSGGITKGYHPLSAASPAEALFTSAGHFQGIQLFRCFLRGRVNVSETTSKCSCFFPQLSMWHFVFCTPINAPLSVLAYELPSSSSESHLSSLVHLWRWQSVCITPHRRANY